MKTEGESRGSGSDFCCRVRTGVGGSSAQVFCTVRCFRCVDTALVSTASEETEAQQAVLEPRHGAAYRVQDLDPHRRHPDIGRTWHTPVGPLPWLNARRVALCFATIVQV